MIEYFWNLLDLPKDDDSMLSVEKAFSECLLEFPPNLITGVRDALELLKPDYKLAIVSDTGFSPGKVLRQLMINENVFDYFSYFSFSDETGVSKPDPLAFSTVIEACGIAPENCAHIGDIESTDIAGAKNLGMKAIRFTGDPTTKFAVNGELPSKADAVMDSWQGIVKYIKELN
jgi:putative hydrolase of the HAD superfamily